MVGTAAMHEHDERWTAVDQYALPHLQPSSSQYHEALRFAEANAVKKGLPDIAVSALQGQYLALQCKLIRAKHILEVGTLGGYSTIWLASIAPDVKVTTIEVSPMHADVARESIENAGLSERVEIIVGAALDVLPRLRNEVEAGSRPSFDFTFIDADKENNWSYLDQTTAMSRQGACIIVDNVVRKGTVANSELAEMDTKVQGSRKVIEEAGMDQRLSATLVQTVGEKNYDGFLLCCVN